MDFYKRKLLSIASFSVLISVILINSAFAASTEIASTILPGNFHISVFGNLTDGIELEGLEPAGSGVQVGYFDAELGTDYLVFSDSTAAPGFRVQMFLGSDFIYDGPVPGQTDIPVSNFSIYANWDDVNELPLAPTKDLDDLSKTLSIDSGGSCSSVDINNYAFNSGFQSGDFAIEMDTVPIDYLTSFESCVNRGVLHLGRFQLNMGVPAEGRYSSSLFVVMVDG